MSNSLPIAWHRLRALLGKEFMQIRRDRLTFAMMVGIPIIELIIFGFAINLDPKNLPMGIMAFDKGNYARSFLSGLVNSRYFKVVEEFDNRNAADLALKQGSIQFLLTLPADFTKKIMRQEKPLVLMEADATDPAATSNALFAIQILAGKVLKRDVKPILLSKGREDLIELRVHRLYNPEGLSVYNIVPGLIGVILTMTMVMMTALAVTRERERGTMEQLLATPARPIEVMIGKILPYVLVGYIQVVVILTASKWVFNTPFLGSLLLLMAVLVLFIAANLAVGFTFSTIAKNQLQAVQMAFFFFLPSILLSGFMFPFRGMPEWAQAIGECLPLTHFLRIVRGILLKGNGWVEIFPEVWPIAIFLMGVSILALVRYRETVD